MLSDKRIVEEMQRGNIVIDPFDERQLGTNSYDCRIGKYFFHQDTSGYVRNVRLFSEKMRSLWGEPLEATRGEIHIDPGTTILAHTIEVVGGRNGFLAKMHTRSTAARSCLSVCRCAGVGDVGYISRWTMEISNISNNVIWIPVGARVCQMVFEEVGETLKTYTGNYGQDKEWTPYDMLPSAKPDWAVEEERQRNVY